MTIEKLKKIANFGARVATGDELAVNKIRSVVYPGLYRRMFYRHTRDLGTKRLFVDVGANIGQGYSIFKSIFDPKYYAYDFFEPNPSCASVLREKFRGEVFPCGSRIFEKAAWLRNERIKFYGIAESKDPLTVGGSVLPNHNSMYYEPNYDESIEVEATCFADYLRDVQTDYDELVLKIDIEGAELDLLEDLWSQEALFVRPALLFVEFHSLYLVGEQKQLARRREIELVRKTPKNVRFFRWY